MYAVRILIRRARKSRNFVHQSVRGGCFRLRRRKARGSRRGFAVTLPDMENGSLLRDRVETGTPLRAVLTRAASKAKKQLLI